MKHIILLALVIGLFAGQASAVMYNLTQSYVLTLDDVAYSDALFPAASNFMTLSSPTTSTITYGTSMQGQVGFFGSLDDTTGDSFAWVKMGDPGADLTLNLSTYSDYSLFVANDNQDIWAARLFLTTGSNTGDHEYVSPWVDIHALTSTTLVLNFANAGIPASELFNVKDIGFYIRGELIGPGTIGYPSDPDGYHMSVLVPVPTAVILGILGMGVVGIKLRKYA